MIEPAILHYCKYQERCHMEVRNKLYELGFTTDTVELQLTELIQNGVLNEERFARSFARGKFRMLHWGRENIKKSFSEINEEEYSNTLDKLTNNKYKEVKSIRSLPMKKSRLYRYLIQKGYERDLVMDAINECINRDK